MKTYMIVTNDSYELPISGEIVGAEAVAEKLGIPVAQLRQSLCRGFAKKAKYKAVIIKDKQIDDKRQYNRDYSKRYGLMHDRTEYYRQHYRRKKEGAGTMAGKTSIQRGNEVRQKILEMIIRYIESHGYPPTIREIGEAVGLASTSSVMSHINKMLCSGMLETDAVNAGSPRAIRVPGYKFVKEEQRDNE